MIPERYFRGGGTRLQIPGGGQGDLLAFRPRVVLIEATTAGKITVVLPDANAATEGGDDYLVVANDNAFAENVSVVNHNSLPLVDLLPDELGVFRLMARDDDAWIWSVHTFGFRD